MKKIVIANQKGGVGKTSIVAHLAWYFEEKGFRVGVIDLDTQGNATFTLSGCTHAGNAVSIFSDKFELDNSDEESGIFLFKSTAELANADQIQIGNAVSQFTKNMRYIEHNLKLDVILIDTAPKISASMIAALASSDFVLTPIELEVYSIQGVNLMLRTIKNIQKTNTALELLGVLPSKVDFRSPRQKKHLIELSKSNEVIPLSIGLRSSVADALEQGIPVWKIKKTTARVAGREIKAVGQFIESAIFKAEV